MKKIAEILDRLIPIEEELSRLYQEAAIKFGSDAEAALFFQNLARDEVNHREFLYRAREALNGMQDAGLPVEIGDDLDDIKKLFEEGWKLMQGPENPKEFMEFVIKAESAEWNEIFLYVARLMARSCSEFKKDAAGAQQHKRTIERFLEDRPEFSDLRKRIKDVGSIWQEKLLVIDDQQEILDVVSAILSGEGRVDESTNGEEAIRKISDTYYAAILTDIEMPVMDGIELYRRAVGLYPSIKDRFLFFSGHFDDRKLSFLKENGLRYIKKPFTIKDIKQEITSVLRRGS